MTAGKMLKFLREFGGPVKMNTICFHFGSTPPIALVVLKQLMAGGLVDRPARGYYMAAETETYKPPKREKKQPHVCPPGPLCTHCRAEKLRKQGQQGFRWSVPRGHISRATE